MHRNSDAIALIAPDHTRLTYRQLYEHTLSQAEALRAMGIQRHSRVAVVLPEGPELATAFLTVTQCAICVPVNPAFSESEFINYFEDVSATHLIVQAGEADLARQATRLRDMPVIELLPGSTAGLFTLSGRIETHPAGHDPVEGADSALILTTSGTTSRPKVVALTHQLLCTRVIIRLPVYQISAADRLLNVMPMFHSSSLTHFLLSLVAGASVICVRGFYAKDFFNWITELQPTWCSAAAAMYETVLTYAPPEPRPHRLRFLRAGSMALPMAVQERLEATFAVPILQAYSSTEAGAIAANPLPPRKAKPGSVGLPMIDLQIVDANGQPLPVNTHGAIVVCGPSVIAGYENDDEATQQAFPDGWFRTGDTGYLDADGFLFLTGRIKEIINRGGEKIFPGEIEAVLRAHPYVRDATVFGIPDTQLGETVGAAAILQPGSTLDEKTLRIFVSERLTSFKVPRRIAFVTAFPRTATGKVKRGELAQALGFIEEILPVFPPSESPLAPMQKAIMEIWSEVLGRAPAEIDLHTRFKWVGGDSLSAVRVLAAIRTRLGIEATLIDLFDKATVAEQAQVLARIIDGGNQTRVDRWLVPLRAKGTRPPAFCVHALQGGVYFYETLLPYISPEHPVLGLQAVGVDGNVEPFSTVDALVTHHLQQICARQPDGPYYLIGFSFGGRLALEIARQLKDDHQQRVHVLMIDDHLPANAASPRKRTAAQRFSTLLFVAFRLPLRYKRLYTLQLLQRFRRALSPQRGLFPVDHDAHLPPDVRRVKEAHKAAARNYIPRPFDGPVTYLRAAGDEVQVSLFRELNRIVRGKLTIIDIPGHHSSIMSTHIEGVGRQVALWLQQAHEVDDNR